MKYAFYPGCTQETTAVEFGASSKAVCHALGIELEEIPDWSCCGASSAHFVDEELSYALPARNLAIAEEQGLDTAVVCAACYLRLRRTQVAAAQSPEFRSRLADVIERPYEAKYGVKHLLDIVVNDLGLEAVRKRVTKPLTGLKVAPYYGCYIVRPPKIVGFDDPENPTTMDRIIEALGAQALDWSGKVDCCGGGLALTESDAVIRLVDNLINGAREVEAEAIVVACPMCHLNLETRQTGKDRLPILYFTELMGLSFGLDEANSWFKKHLVSPLKLLKSHNLL